jgi:hypothetical protein
MKRLEWVEYEFCNTSMVEVENKDGDVTLSLSLNDGRKKIGLESYIEDREHPQRLEIDLENEHADKFVEMLKKLIKIYESA